MADMLSFFLPIGSVVLGGLLLHFIKEFLLQPRFEIEFKDDANFLALTRDSSNTQMKYLRCRITNKGWRFLKVTARNCRVFISDLKVTHDGVEVSEKEQPIEEWFSLPFSHSDKTISDLPTGIPQFVDTFYVAKSQLDQLKLPFFPKQYESFLKKSGTFTARIYVVADNVSVKSKEIKFQWSAGSFDSLKIIDNESQYSDDSM